MVLEGFFNFIFGLIVNNLPPRWSLVVISFILTFLITLVYKLLTNQTLMKSLKEEMKTLQNDAKKFKDDQEKSLDYSKRLMQKNLEYMRHSMRPTLFTFIPIILVFGWLRKTYIVHGDLFHWGFSLPLFGAGIGWLMTYIVSSIIFSVLIRKFMKIH